MGTWVSERNFSFNTSEFYIVSFGVESDQVDYTLNFFFSDNKETRIPDSYNLSLIQDSGGTLALLHPSDSSRLPLELNFSRVNGEALYTFCESGQSFRVENPITNKDENGYYLQITIAMDDLLGVMAGDWGNSYRFKITPDNGNPEEFFFTVEFKIPQLIKIGLEKDLVLDGYTRYDRYRGVAEVCVYINYDGSYRASVQSRNFAEGNFRVCSEAGYCVPYWLDYRRLDGGEVNYIEADGKSTPLLKGDRQWFKKCTTGIAKYRIRARVEGENYRKALAGTYTDHLVITVIPE